MRKHDKVVGLITRKEEKKNNLPEYLTERRYEGKEKKAKEGKPSQTCILSVLKYPAVF